MALRVLLLVACLSPAAPCAEPDAALFSARVVRVLDGDSLVVQPDGHDAMLTLRLEGIDAPEPLQLGGTAAKRYLAELLPPGNPVVVHALMPDKYSRLLARIYLRTKDPVVSQRLVSAGHAWHFAKYNRDSGLATAQRTAQSQRVGLWKYRMPHPPWLFRIQINRGEVMPDDAEPVHSPNAAMRSVFTQPRFTAWLNTDGKRHQIACRDANLATGKLCNNTEGEPCPRCQVPPQK